MTPSVSTASRTDERLSPVPPVPRTIEDTGLALDQLEQLLVKTMYGAEATGMAISERLRLPYALIEPLIERVRAQLLVEVRGASGSGTAGYRYALTDLGRDRARQFLAISNYAGAAPVPLSAYTAEMGALRVARGYVDRDRIRHGFSHLVLCDEVFDKVGPAINAGKAVFLYGPPGNGKTVIAEGMGRTLGGDMYVPYAIDVDGHVVTVFDPIAHESLEGDPESTTSVVAGAPRDRRWVRIRRPVVIVGGELTLDMLDLTFNPISKFYEAPLQLKANGGVFLVDDFGRERISPDQLLNRFITPMEHQVDYFTLATGQKIQVPLRHVLIICTNLDPEKVTDPAFLRRMGYRLSLDAPNPEQYAEIFRAYAKRYDLTPSSELLENLMARYRENNRELRACEPRDLVERARDICRFRGKPLELSPEIMGVAWVGYFGKHAVTQPEYASANDPAAKP